MVRPYAIRLVEIGQYGILYIEIFWSRGYDLFMNRYGILYRNRSQEQATNSEARLLAKLELHFS